MRALLVVFQFGKRLRADMTLSSDNLISGFGDPLCLRLA